MKTDKKTESRRRARAAAELAAQGKYRCWFCKQVKPVEEGIVTTWGGNVLFALCPECHPGRPIVMDVRNDSEGRRGVYVGFLRDEDKPSRVTVASDLSEAESAVSPSLLAQYKKASLG